MFHRIVVPLDGSKLAEQALPHAEGLARIMNLPLHLVRIVDPTHLGTPIGTVLNVDAVLSELMIEDERIAAREYLERIQQDLLSRHPMVTVERRQGLAANELLAALRPADLLVLASHGRGMLGRWFMGSVAEKVLRRTTAPVWLVRSNPNEPAPFVVRRLVVPLDGSPLAEEALPIALEFARCLHVPVELLTVIDLSSGLPIELATTAVSAKGFKDAVSRLYGDAELSIAQPRQRLEAEGITVSTRVLHGLPGMTIVDATAPGDLIVMTSHGRIGLPRWFLGSVAEDVVRHAPVPVLIMRSSSQKAVRTARGLGSSKEHVA